MKWEGTSPRSSAAGSRSSDRAPIEASGLGGGFLSGRGWRGGHPLPRGRWHQDGGGGTGLLILLSFRLLFDEAVHYFSAIKQGLEMRVGLLAARA